MNSSITIKQFFSDDGLWFDHFYRTALVDDNCGNDADFQADFISFDYSKSEVRHPNEQSSARAARDSAASANS